MVTRHAIGFGRGFLAPFGAMGSLLRSPRAWPFALVPSLLFGVLELAFVALAWLYLRPRVTQAVAGASWLEWIGIEALQRAVPELASLGAVLLAAWLGWRLSAPLASALSSPALERLVGITEAELGAPERAPLGFLSELGCGARSMLLGLALTVPLEVALTLLELLIPPVSVVTTPGKFLLGALGVAWGLFDYPLTLRGMRARERFSFMIRHLSVVLGFGIAFALVFLVPCFGTLMLPVGVVAATRLYWVIERAAPTGIVERAKRAH
jgi:uncharacterized protein involved in cysteine biosynthesis